MQICCAVVPSANRDNGGDGEAVAIPDEMFRALLPAIEDILVAETIQARVGQPEMSWEDAFASVGVTQEAVDAVDLSNFRADVS